MSSTNFSTRVLNNSTEWREVPVDEQPHDAMSETGDEGVFVH